MTDETHPKMPAFRSLDVPESNFTSYPAAHRAINQNRYNRRLGDHAGLQNYGVNLTRIIPGGQSSYRHAHSHQDEFVFVLEGKVVLETNAGAQTLTKGMCAGFPAGTGDAHRFVNPSDTDVLLLVVGDRTPGDEITYPDFDMHATLGPDGRYRFTTRAGQALTWGVFWRSRGRKVPAPGAELKARMEAERLVIESTGPWPILDFDIGKPIAVRAISDVEFYVDGGDHTRIVFISDHSGRVTGAILNPGPREVKGIRID